MNIVVDAHSGSSYTARHCPMSTVITSERPDTPEARALIEELDAHLIPLYPTESHHGFTVEQLIAEGVAFFVTHYDENPAGCGGLKFYDTEFGEIKRMYVRPQFRGLGLGKLMVNHLVDYARERGIRVLKLETGIRQVEAIGLYEQMGFRPIPPFGAYKEDPLSRFYERQI